MQSDWRWIVFIVILLAVDCSFMHCKLQQLIVYNSLRCSVALQTHFLANTQQRHIHMFVCTYKRGGQQTNIMFESIILPLCYANLFIELSNPYQMQTKEHIYSSPCFNSYAHESFSAIS